MGVSEIHRVTRAALQYIKISSNTNLLPGDYLGSGTVGTGCILELRPENTNGWVQKGDVVTLEVERLGVLENKII